MTKAYFRPGAAVTQYLMSALAAASILLAFWPSATAGAEPVAAYGFGGRDPGGLAASDLGPGLVQADILGLGKGLAYGVDRYLIDLDDRDYGPLPQWAIKQLQAYFPAQDLASLVRMKFGTVDFPDQTVALFTSPWENAVPLLQVLSGGRLIVSMRAVNGTTTERLLPAYAYAVQKIVDQRPHTALALDAYEAWSYVANRLAGMNHDRARRNLRFESRAQAMKQRVIEDIEKRGHVFMPTRALPLIDR